MKEHCSARTFASGCEVEPQASLNVSHRVRQVCVVRINET
jgi:hypothetical protein